MDDQSRTLYYYRGTENGVEAGMNFSNARESVTAKHLNSNMINCMAHNSTSFFTNKYSAITRCSIDYRFGDQRSGRSNIWQSFNNSLWIGQTVWPDHDMFHSSDPKHGQLMAVSRALSGAPIYLSDEPNDMIEDFIMPLCYEDGFLLRPETPTIPLPESAILNPMVQKEAYRVIAPLAHNSAVVALYNLHDSVNTTITAKLNPDDYKYRTGLLQPYPSQQPQPEEGLILYDWYERKGYIFDKEYSTDLTGFSDKLLLICPIEKGWSVIGRNDKYLSPEAISRVEYYNNNVVLTLQESGPLVVYSALGIQQIDDKKGIGIGNNFYLFSFPVGDKNIKIVINR